MEILILLIVVVAIMFIGLVVVGIAEWVNHSKTLRESYARLAARYRGTSKPGGWFHRPSARFLHGGAHVLVDIFDLGRAHIFNLGHRNVFNRSHNNEIFCTQVHINWPDPTIRCEVYPTDFFTRIGKFLGMTTFEIGSPQFDQNFQVNGNDARGIRQLLSPDVQETINGLRSNAYNGEIYILFSAGTLLVKKRGLIREYDALTNLVELSLELFERALLTLPSGIEFIAGPPPALGPPVCQVCGDAIAGDLVQCKSCKTPHHKECWTYYGACSTYGCGEKRYTTPRRDSLRRAS